MITRARAALARWVDGYRADREESWGHAPTWDDEGGLRRWLRKVTRR